MIFYHNLTNPRRLSRMTMVLSGLLLVVFAFAGDAHSRTLSSEPSSFTLATIDTDRIDEAVRKIIDSNTDLEPRLWDGMTLKSGIRDHAVALAKKVVADLDVPQLAVNDIVLLGSAASYEYDDHSDFDLHVFVDASAFEGDQEILKKFIYATNYLNRQRFEATTFLGYPFEIMVYVGNPADQRHAGVGMYSLLSKSWIAEPSRHLEAVDPGEIAANARYYIGRYNEIARDFNKSPLGFDCARFGMLSADLRDYRSKGIALSGIRSTANLTYRMLRRLSVDLPETLRAGGRRCEALNASLF